VPDRSAEAGPTEVELKYRLTDAASGERFLAADALGPFRASSAARTAQHEDRYLDTSDGALAKAGFAARLRQTNAGTIVSVKATTALDGALARREELEGEADRTAEPRDWPPSAARSLILELCGDAPLVELVTVRQLRRKRRLKAPDASVELSVDEVDVVARGRVIDRFAELEVELTSGEESRLAELRAVLEKDDVLSPATSSKLEAALAASEIAGVSHGGNGAAAGARTIARERGEAQSPVRDGRRGPGRRAGRGATGREPGAERKARNDRQGSDRDAASGATAGARVDGGQRRAARAKTVTTADEKGQRRPASGPAEPGTEETAKPTANAVAAAPASPPLVVGKTPGVTAEDVLPEAGRKVLRFHLARMLAQEPGTRDGNDPEDLHKMRVATRRMRAAWRVFGEGFQKVRTKRHRRRLREVAGRLGAVRDLDVLIEAGEAYLATQSHTEQRAAAPLFEAWREQRDDARILLVRELESDAYRRWVDDFRDFVRNEGAGAAAVIPTAPHRIRDRAASQIWTAYEQIRAYEPVLRWADVATLHELRIAGKWLRYTLEFVRECLGPDAAGLIARVTAMQDHLGLMHDADVAASMTRAFLVERSGRLSEAETAAIGRYLMDREREVARLRRTVGPVWRGVGGLAFRRGLGRAVAVL
jgi:CHAD domain-containing protein/adenylate cyclase class IV